MILSTLSTPAAPAEVGFWSRELLGNPLSTWMTALFIAVGLSAVMYAARSYIVRRVKAWAERTAVRLDDLLVAVVGEVRWPTIVMTAIWAGSTALVLPFPVERALWLLLLIVLAVQALLTVRIVVEFGMRALLSRKLPAEREAAIRSASGVIRFVTMLAFGTVMVLLVLANLDIEITPLIASLGIGGIAVALAAQSILADLFASVSILLDQPFLVGDFIVVGEQKGTVEAIGVKTTRVRALSGEQLVFSNADLLASRIQNFKRMRERRVGFTLNVVYDTPVEKLERIPVILRDIVQRFPNVRFNNAHLKQLGAYSIDFDCVYYMLSPDALEYQDVHQAICLEILRRFGEEGIDLAYPTQVEIQRPFGEVARA